MLSKRLKIFFFVYISLITLALITSNFIIPYIEPIIIPFIDNYIDEKYHKNIIVVLSISVTMPIMFFFIIPNVKNLIG